MLSYHKYKIRKKIIKFSQINKTAFLKKNFSSAQILRLSISPLILDLIEINTENTEA